MKQLPKLIWNNRTNLSQTSQKLTPYMTPDALLPHAASDVKVMH